MAVIRKTKSVQSVLHQFENGIDARSVTDLVAKLKGEMNKTTVYRILERLENQGTLHSFIGKDGLRWYAMCKDCSHEQHNDIHPHFQCKECGTTECLTIEVKVPTLNNHQIESVEMLLTGTCEKCISKA